MVQSVCEDRPFVPLFAERKVVAVWIIPTIHPLAHMRKKFPHKLRTHTITKIIRYMIALFKQKLGCKFHHLGNRHMLCVQEMTL